MAKPGRPHLISFDRQVIVGPGGADAVNLHWEPRKSHTNSHQDPHVCGLGEERQANRDAEYDVSQRIDACRARACGGIVGDRRRVEITRSFENETYGAMLDCSVKSMRVLESDSLVCSAW
jgi:hypothetical protein